MDWQSKAIELLRVEIDDLIGLARLAGADPATFYEGANLSGIELTPAEAAALAGASGAAEPEEPVLDTLAASTQQPEGSRKGVLALNIGARTAQAGRPGIGLVIQEPTVLLRNQNGRLFVGQEALDEYSFDTGDFLTSPFSEDKIQDPDTAAYIVRHLISAAKASRAIGGLDVLHAVPATAGSVQRRALEESSRKAGARRVRFVDAPLAAAIGAGLIVDSPRAAMVLVVGDYLAEVQVISLSGRVATASARAGLDVMERAIASYFQRVHDMGIASSTARDLRDSVGSPFRRDKDDAQITVAGRSMISGHEIRRQVRVEDIRTALELAVGNIIELAKTAIESTPPELAGDIGEAGFLLTGSGATLPGLGRLLVDWTGLQVMVSQAPERTIIEGCAGILENPDWMDLPFIHDVNAPTSALLS